MPTRLPCLLLAAAALLTGAAPAFGQFGYRMIIKDVKIGFPPGKATADRQDGQQAGHVTKRNAWAPVYLTLELKKEVPARARVVIEANDGDSLRTSVSYPLGSFAERRPGEIVQAVELPRVPLVRASDFGTGDITVTLYTDDSDGRQLSESRKVQVGGTRGGSNYVVLSLGSKLPGFDLPKDNNPNSRPMRNGHVETAAYTTVEEMPDEWFGYSAADVVVLTTGSAPQAFLSELFSTQSETGKSRRAALMEWVRRGGKLIVSVGSNAGLLQPMTAFQDILPAKLRTDGPSQGMKELNLNWKTYGLGSVSLSARTDSFPVAQWAVDPARPVRYLLPTPSISGAGIDPVPPAKPVVVQVPFGLGRITAVAFDLDRSPFVDAITREKFWDWLLRAAGAELASVGSGNPTNSSPYGNQEDGFSSSLRGDVDSFEGVPVISFGWVALFIALYTLLIGPVEYIFLKKVVGRLELTWITFPLIVLTVSAAAYFTAYAIKGNDLRVNKIDLVDIDEGTGRVYGHSWFTIFSPRIDSYTIGLEPREGWTKARADGPSPLVDWMPGSGGSGGGIVSRGYSYHTDFSDPARRRVADGLTGVPIQVWSTKAFTANWSGELDRTALLIESRLYHPPGKKTELAGSFVSRIPVDVLTDAVLVYAGKTYPLRPLTPGAEVAFSTSQPASANDWFVTNAGSAWRTNDDRYLGYRPPSTNDGNRVQLPLWGALFHERVVRNASALQNSSLRDLDQSWRVSEKEGEMFLDQAILLARAAPLRGAAEAIMADPAGPSVTKLWLNAIPGTGESRSTVPGVMRQDTYIRAYLPVGTKPKQ